MRFSRAHATEDLPPAEAGSAQACRTRPLRRRLRAMLLAVAAVAAGCGGSLSHRSVDELSGDIPIGQGVARVRIEITNGTLGLDSNDMAAVAYAGGVRRAADTAEDLALLERVPLVLTGEPDAQDPTTLVVRCPAPPPGAPRGMLGLELGIRLPSSLPLEVRVLANGHVTVANRAARTTVETGRGDLRFEGCAGGVFAKTGRGNVIAFEHRGDLDVHTVIGDMQAFVREPGTLIRLATGQGTVQCHVPPTIEFDLDARAEIGRIGNGFGLTPETVRDYGAALTGKRGSAATRIVLRTGSGHLSLSPRRYE